MATLSRDLRRELERTVIKARRTAEDGARKAIESLAVHNDKPWSTLSDEQKRLRIRLRAHGRQLGDHEGTKRDTQTIDHLVQECAYEHWHRMLFARFLAENDLLIEPEARVAISLDECRELARERGADWLALASDFGVRMLPQIFRQGDPVLEIALPLETRQELEALLKALPGDVFADDDSLGWVYQFWQTEQKEQVNKSGVKIGADELAAVTQLFTEDYMVLFLLHNTLGAWWAGKVLAAKPQIAAQAKNEDELRAACSVGDYEWTYLRFIRELPPSSPLPSPPPGERVPGRAGEGMGCWRPAAGTFDGWPRAAHDLRVLDPCMGSGHFLVFALPILVAFRMQEEGLSQEQAVDAVLRDNLFGLELDNRCTQIAAFNLALTAWRMAGYRPLPALNLACSGLGPQATKEQWLELADRAAVKGGMPAKRDLFRTEQSLLSSSLANSLESMYEFFARAPILGSLIDPRRLSKDLYQSGYDALAPLLNDVFEAERDDETRERAIAAAGMVKAAELLAREYTLVITNVPYLGRGKQDEILKDYCEKHHGEAKSDLATCFVDRCLRFCFNGGSMALVTPQNWLFLTTYTAMRRRLLRDSEWTIVVKLGPAAFHDMNWWAANTSLLSLTNRIPHPTRVIAGTDVSDTRDPDVKAALLWRQALRAISQRAQLGHPDCRLLLSSLDEAPLLEQYAGCLQGVSPADFSRYGRRFWEGDVTGAWRPWQTTVDKTVDYGGRELAIWWGDGLQEAVEAGTAFVRGKSAWGQRGVVVRQMRHLPCTLYTGEVFDTNCAVISPRREEELTAIWAFCSSEEYTKAVRQLDQKTNVTNATLVKVPFDVGRWERTASEMYPNGLPRPHSDDPTQWLFNGHPKGSDHPLQVAIARLLGYRWPRQTGSSFMDCPALDPDGLEKHADRDGIVCLSPVKGQRGAADPLRALLADAYGPEWSAQKLKELLGENESLEAWLRDRFFEEHCRIFHQRPFIWHVWDGLRDGFHALVNYHNLAAPSSAGRQTLEKLIYSYLGDWIDRQRADQKNGVEGADARVAAAQHLQTELKKIVEGEPPYDIFVRWKPLHEQPIGWEPDINDGVRLNIRPFMAAKVLNGRGKGACILRATPKIKWEKDRGKEPHRSKEDSPWFWSWDGATSEFTGGREFDGNRWNDLHYTRKHKQEARDRTQHTPA